jgi:hypothetical protein
MNSCRLQSFATHLSESNMQVANTTKLAPAFVATVEAAAAAMFDGKRARPACCYTADGKAVVCSARTARKNGWTIVARAWR